MNILVLNGSPKGDFSVTKQTVDFIAKNFDKDNFETINIGQQLKKYTENISLIKDNIAKADLILFSYPVYTFIAPYQLQKFIEVLKTSGINLDDKFATQITTSKHFYDFTAHNYIKENCFDLNLKYIDGLSADMDDLLTTKGQTDAIAFFEYVSFCIEKNIFVKPRLQSKDVAAYLPGVSETKKRQEPFDTVIVTDAMPNDTSLWNMIEDFKKLYPYAIRIANLNDFKFSGGCLGCFNCASDGKCVYKDGFENYLRNTIQSASAIIYAFKIRDHSMGSKFKLFDDRQFCNGHRAVTMGTPVGYIVSGDIDNEQNLQTIIKGRSEVGRNFLAGIVSETSSTASDLKELSDKMAYALKNNLLMPQNFLGIGGAKIFRDLIFVMRGLMREDNKFFKKNKFYDFPQKKVGTIWKMKFVGWLMSMPAVKKNMKGEMNNQILKPYKKVIANYKKK